MSSTVSQSLLDGLAAELVALGCTGGLVCECPPQPGAICDNHVCTLAP